MSVTSAKTGSTSLSLALENNFMEPIASTLVGAGGVSAIIFNDIPQTYKHLQLRVMAITPSTGYHNFEVIINGDFGYNYATHQIQGNGATASASSQATTNRYTFAGLMNPTNAYPFVSIMDILDYTNANKNKTMRSFAGANNNAADTGARVTFSSGLWINKSAITSIRCGGGDFGQYTRISLYGIKG